MKHFLFHLISVVLLVILFLVVLDLARDKQVMQKRIDGLTEKNAAAEELLGKERTDNASKAVRLEAENKDL